MPYSDAHRDVAPTRRYAELADEVRSTPRETERGRRRASTRPPLDTRLKRFSDWIEDHKGVLAAILAFVAVVGLLVTLGEISNGSE